jgi:hypothetical protein
MSVRSLHITNIGTYIVLLAALCLAPAILLPHGSGKHIRGFVEKVSSESITVKTTAGKIVEAAVGTNTTYTRSDLPIQKTDIKVGDRIVIHAAEVRGKLVADSVQIGTAGAGQQPAKRPAKQ